MYEIKMGDVSIINVELIYENNNEKIFVDSIVDQEDFCEVQKYNWFIKDGYQNIPHTYGPEGKLVSLARFIMQYLHCNDIPKNYMIDHMDNNKLNNTKANIHLIPFKSKYNI